MNKKSFSIVIGAILFFVTGHLNAGHKPACAPGKTQCACLHMANCQAHCGNNNACFQNCRSADALKNYTEACAASTGAAAAVPVETKPSAPPSGAGEFKAWATNDGGNINIEWAPDASWTPDDKIYLFGKSATGQWCANGVLTNAATKAYRWYPGSGSQWFYCGGDGKSGGERWDDGRKVFIFKLGLVPAKDGNPNTPARWSNEFVGTLK